MRSVAQLDLGLCEFFMRRTRDPRKMMRIYKNIQQEEAAKFHIFHVY
jgi:hypothetical protein